jgi:hypothetical protein
MAAGLQPLFSDCSEILPGAFRRTSYHRESGLHGRWLGPSRRDRIAGMDTRRKQFSAIDTTKRQTAVIDRNVDA